MGRSAFSFAVLAALGLAGCGKPDPKLTVEFAGGLLGSGITITSHDDRPIVIEKIVVNKRADIQECVWNKSPATPPPKDSGIQASELNPKQMRLGDTADFYISISAMFKCNRPVKVDVETDQGSLEYEFNS